MAEALEEDQNALRPARYGTSDGLAARIDLSPGLAGDGVAIGSDKSGHDLLESFHDRLGCRGSIDREVTRPLAVDECVIEAARVELRMAVGDASAGPAAGPVVLIIEPEGRADLLCLVERGIHRLPERLLQVQSSIHPEPRVGQGGVYALLRHHSNLPAHRLRIERPVPKPERRLAAHPRRLAPELEDLLDGRRQKPAWLRPGSLGPGANRRQVDDESEREREVSFAHGRVASFRVSVFGSHAAIVPGPSSDGNWVRFARLPPVTGGIVENAPLAQPNGPKGLAMVLFRGEGILPLFFEGDDRVSPIPARPEPALSEAERMASPRAICPPAANWVRFARLPHARRPPGPAPAG